MEFMRITSLADLSTDIGISAISVTNIAMMLCGAALAVGLIVVIYKLSQGTNGAKESLIGWFAAVIVYSIAVTYILTVSK